MVTSSSTGSKWKLFVNIVIFQKHVHILSYYTSWCLPLTFSQINGKTWNLELVISMKGKRIFFLNMKPQTNKSLRTLLLNVRTTCMR